MTEKKWLKSKKPLEMLEYLRTTRPERVLWLFVVACFQRVWPFLDENVHAAMHTTARYADGQATHEEMLKYNTNVEAMGSVRHAIRRGQELAGKAAEAQAQADLVREIAGNPFRPVRFAPEWRTDTVVTLAQQMYDSRDFSAMPILADALQDAGCNNEGILAHCRSEGPHVRGCWVVDLVLGKS